MEQGHSEQPHSTVGGFGEWAGAPVCLFAAYKALASAYWSQRASAPNVGCWAGTPGGLAGAGLVGNGEGRTRLWQKLSCPAPGHSPWELEACPTTGVLYSFGFFVFFFTRIWTFPPSEMMI